MAIVSLTTDFGEYDYYVGSIKGALLCANPQLNIIDITHNIKNYDIVQAAYIIKNAYKSFPAGSIHILSVNNFYQSHPVFLILKHREHYFIAPDNGILSLLFDELPQQIYTLSYEDESTFPMEQAFARAVAHISQNLPFDEIGSPVDGITERINFQPVLGPSYIKGAVIHIDQYENIIINIKESLFEQVGQGRNFRLYFKRDQPITTLSNYYSDVAVGETLCLFNSVGDLEIAINMGKAASMLGLKIDDVVQIEFQE